MRSLVHTVPTCAIPAQEEKSQLSSYCLLLHTLPQRSSRSWALLGFAGLCWAWSLCCNTNRAVSGTLPLGFCFSSLPNLWARPSPCLLRQAVSWEHLTVCRDELVEPHTPPRDYCGEMHLAGGDTCSKSGWEELSAGNPSKLDSPSELEGFGRTQLHF